MAVAIVTSPSSFAACVGARYCSGCLVLMAARGAEGQWRDRGPTRGSGFGDVNYDGLPHRSLVQVTPQITIRTAPEATRPRKGEDDGLRQAPFLVPSCSPSLRCCGTCDDDDASPAASDPDHDGPDSVAYYPVGSTSSTPSPSPSSSPSPQPSSFIVVILDFELLGERDLIQFVHVEYYFNELNEFDHPSSSTSSTATSSSTPNTPVSTPDTKPSSTTGNSAPRTKTTGARKRRRPDHDCDHDDPKETTTKTTATATRRQWRRLRLRRQRGDHPTTSNSATTTRKEGRKAYIEQNDRRAATTDPVHPPENSKLLREPTNCGANYIRGPDSRPFNSSVSAGDYPDCDLKRRMSHEVYARPQPDSKAAHRYCHTAANHLIEHHRVGTRTCKSRVSLTPTAESVAKIGMESRLRAAKWGGKGKGGDRGGTSTHDREHGWVSHGCRFFVRVRGAVRGSAPSEPRTGPEPDRTSQRFKVRPESPNRTRVRFGVQEKRSPNRTAPDRGIPNWDGLASWSWALRWGGGGGLAKGLGGGSTCESSGGGDKHIRERDFRGKQHDSDHFTLLELVNIFIKNQFTLGFYPRLLPDRVLRKKEPQEGKNRENPPFASQPFSPQANSMLCITVPRIVIVDVIAIVFATVVLVAVSISPGRRLRWGLAGWRHDGGNVVTESCMSRWHGVGTEGGAFARRGGSGRELACGGGWRREPRADVWQGGGDVAL
ncbi:hypothetical protein EDB85DRAFT_1895777 [Lactarius pseudohatsudake]|nr:hypothetical protein EDB85DRAFT_1895777 [Lactarius pseudohatsudake]